MSIEEAIQSRRAAIISNIEKAFDAEIGSSALPDFLEKAYYEGDLLFLNGKTYVYTQYAPGKFDWHVLNPKNKKTGTGYNGQHGAAGVKSAFKDLNPQYTDPNKMVMRRTPNGNWRLYYDGQDAGVTLAPDSFTEAELKSDGMTYQGHKVVDNFDLLKSYMQFNNPGDDVYFVQIIKRWKDNKDKPGADAWKAQGKAQGTYGHGGEYLNYWLISSPEDLDKARADIIRAAEYNNARAYISINPRSKSQVDQYIDKFKARFGNNPNDPRVKYAEAILYGQAKTGPAWRNERFRVLLDIDTPRDSKVTLPDGSKVNVWDETKKRLADQGILTVAEYETPSGGLHLILNNKNNRNLPAFYRGLRDFDGGRDLGMLATVHPSEDIKMVLYSNAVTAGY